MLRHRFHLSARYPTIGVVCLVVFSVTAPTALGDDAARERQASALIRQLSDKEFKVRQAAAKAIETLGPEALPALRKARNNLDPDVRRRIEKWIPEFEIAAFVAPKLIELNVTNQSLKNVIDELGRQTAYKLKIESGHNDRKCTFSFHHVPFWKALDDICQNQKLAISHQAGADNSLYLSFSERADDHVAHDRAFRMAADHLEYRKETSEVRTVQLGLQPAYRRSSKDGSRVTEILVFQFTLAAEPRLKILWLGEPDITEAATEQKRSLIPRKETDPVRRRINQRMLRAEFRQPFFDGGSHSVKLQLEPPSSGERVLKSLRGTLPIHLEKEERTAVLFDDLSKAQGKSVKLNQETVRVDLFDSRPMGSSHRLGLTVVGDKGAGEAGDSESDGHFELQDAKGNSYQPHGSSSSWDGNKREYEYRFGPPFGNAAALGPPQKLVYKKSISSVYHVPFEFKDLPLP